MSIFWDRKLYTAYKYTVGSKSNKHQRITWHWYPCPGFNGHSAIIGDQRGETLFRRFNNRPQKSWLLYWRSHPVEYLEILKAVK